MVAKKTTVIRKRKPKNKDLTKSTSVSKKMEAVGLFISGKSYEEIATKLGWTKESIYTEIRKHYLALKNIIETENLIAAQKADLAGSSKAIQGIQLYNGQQKIDKDINAKFLSKLSPPMDTVLSQEEILFSYLLVHEGDQIKALVDSGLATGLVKANAGYKRAIKLRILMLKGKKNIIRYISDLQVSYAKEMNVNKEAIQGEILRQLNQLKEQNDPRLAPTIAKLTEQLGRTIGAFTDKVQIEEVSFDEAMDKMLEMRRVNGTEETSKVKSTETYVYDPEKIK